MKSSSFPISQSIHIDQCVVFGNSDKNIREPPSEFCVHFRNIYRKLTKRRGPVDSVGQYSGQSEPVRELEWQNARYGAERGLVRSHGICLNCGWRTPAAYSAMARDNPDVERLLLCGCGWPSALAQAKLYWRGYRAAKVWNHSFLSDIWAGPVKVGESMTLMNCHLRGVRGPSLPGIEMQIQVGIHSSDSAGRNWCIFRQVNFGVRSIGSIVSGSTSS